MPYSIPNWRSFLTRLIREDDKSSFVLTSTHADPSGTTNF
jgi:hypothetical protein